MNDELKKLGLRIRPRTAASKPAAARAASRAPAAGDQAASRTRPGHIAPEERSNTLHAWNDMRLHEGDDKVPFPRNRPLHNPDLQIVEDEPEPNASIRSNVSGLHLGYDPYESGLLAKKRWKKKPSLRELSKWMELKRKLGGNASEN